MCYSSPLTEWSERLLVLKGPEKDKVLQQVQAAVQAAVPLGPHDPDDTMLHEVSLSDRDAVWGLWQAPAVNCSTGL